MPPNSAAVGMMKLPNCQTAPLWCNARVWSTQSIHLPTPPFCLGVLVTQIPLAMECLSSAPDEDAGQDNEEGGPNHVLIISDCNGRCDFVSPVPASCPRVLPPCCLLAMLSACSVVMHFMAILSLNQRRDAFMPYKASTKYIRVVECAFLPRLGFGFTTLCCAAWHPVSGMVVFMTLHPKPAVFILCRVLCCSCCVVLAGLWSRQLQPR